MFPAFSLAYIQLPSDLSIMLFYPAESRPLPDPWGVLVSVMDGDGDAGSPLTLPIYKLFLRSLPRAVAVQAASQRAGQACRHILIPPSVPAGALPLAKLHAHAVASPRCIFL